MQPVETKALSRIATVSDCNGPKTVLVESGGNSCMCYVPNLSICKEKQVRIWLKDVAGGGAVPVTQYLHLKLSPGEVKWFHITRQDQTSLIS